MIGSRDTPEIQRLRFLRLGAIMASLGYVIYSGGARGMDDSAERGARLWLVHHDRQHDIAHQLRIFLPRDGFDPGGGLPKRYRREGDHIFLLSDLSMRDTARGMTKKFHPKSEKLSQYQAKLMDRNAFQVLDLDLETPVDMVICWTPDGCIDGRQTTRQTGGTGHALRISADHGVPIFNDNFVEHRNRLSAFMDKHRSVWEPLDEAFHRIAGVDHPNSFEMGGEEFAP